MALKFVAGLSVASLLAAGTWAAVSRPGASAQAETAGRVAPGAAPAPAAVMRAFALPEGAAKADRPLRGAASALRQAAGPGAGAPRPLSGDAFKRRFPAVSFAAPGSIPGLASRFVAARLMERPKAGEVRTAFAQGPAPAPREAAVFHPLKPAIRLAPADALAAAGAAPKVEAPIVLASLPSPAEAAETETAFLPDSVAAPLARPRTAPSRAASPAKPAPAADDSVPGVLAPAGPPRAVSSRMTGVATPAPARSPATLAYARPNDPADDAVLKPKIPWPGTGRRVAYYDISAGVVHMPSGEKLEAHSGRGRMRDNPSFAHVKMRGPTPPSTYRLSMREARFHGVEAIRLTPVDGVAPHGRVGLLAHTYLLRNAPPGDSSGCIAFKDYKRFLKAFKRGEVDRIVVVPRMRGAPALAAKFASLMPRSR